MKEKEEEISIKTFADACNAVGCNPETVVPDMSSYPEHLRVPLVAAAKLFIINQALNSVNGESWKPDWNDNDEYKYYPWFDMEKTEDNPSGFGLYVADCVHSYSSVGSRLVYRTRKLALYAGKQFEDIYRDMMVIF